MFRIMGYAWMIFTGATCAGFSFYTLMQTGAPIMGLTLFASGVLFTGGWCLIAQELDDA